METNYNKSWNGQINNLDDFKNYIPISQESNIDNNILTELLSHSDIFQKLSVDSSNSSLIVDGNLKCDSITINDTTLTEEMLINLLEHIQSNITNDGSDVNADLNEPIEEEGGEFNLISPTTS